ncbi:MAG: hypothetical protein AAGI28_05685 [Pseudomonadota bacterium]
MADDRSTIPLRTFLKRKGFQCEGWGLGTNNAGKGLVQEFDEVSETWDLDTERTNNGEADVPALCDAMVRRVEERFADLGEPIILIGWSLGGFVARETARELPDKVRAVITIRSPVVGGPKYTLFAPLYARRGYDLDWVEEETINRHLAPITQPITSIYSKRDGIVGWKSSIDHWSPNVDHIEVSTTHMGMGINREVWDIIVKQLIELHEPNSSNKRASHKSSR